MVDKPQWSYKEVDKSLATRVVELIRSLQIIRDALNEIAKGRLHHTVPLSGQLRSLLTERAKGADPLLFWMSDVFGIPPDVYSMPDVAAPDMPENLRENLTLHISGFPLSLRPQFASQTKNSLKAFLDSKLILLKEKHYTPRDVIEWHANLVGGAHYSRRVPEDFETLSAFSFSGIQLLTDALIQLGRATLETGWNLLREIINFEMHFSLIVPKQNIGEGAWIFDSHYQDSPMRIGLALNNRLMPAFFARGIQGNVIQIESDCLIDWSAARHFQIIFSIENDLSTVVELLVDGARIGKASTPEPVFVLSDPIEYETYYNRPIETAGQDFCFGMGASMMFKGTVAPADRAKILLHFEERKNDPGINYAFYTAGSFGHIPVGTTDMTMTGEVKLLKATDILTE